MMIEGHWVNFVPVAMMVAILVANHALTHHRSGRREDVEGTRLKAALTAELKALRELYQKNLKLLESEAGYLISTRAPMIIYKSNQAKLTALIEAELLEKLVSLYAKNDMIEEILSANASANGPLSFKLRPECDSDELKGLYAEGMQQIARTWRMLNPEAQAARATLQRSVTPAVSARPNQESARA
ncbi:MAG: hypothetical protein K2Y27_11445 [Xanthobacteraceae bacterium]|nr:hypothetical protein [Xanthobacteraceae bacterium]